MALLHCKRFGCLQSFLEKGGQPPRQRSSLWESCRRCPPGGSTSPRPGCSSALMWALRTSCRAGGWSLTIGHEGVLGNAVDKDGEDQHGHPSLLKAHLRAPEYPFRCIGMGTINFFFRSPRMTALSLLSRSSTGSLSDCAGTLECFMISQEFIDWTIRYLGLIVGVLFVFSSCSIYQSK